MDNRYQHTHFSTSFMQCWYKIYHFRASTESDTVVRIHDGVTKIFQIDLDNILIIAQCGHVAVAAWLGCQVRDVVFRKMFNLHNTSSQQRISQDMT